MSNCDIKNPVPQKFRQLKKLNLRFNHLDSRQLHKLNLRSLECLSFIDISNNRLQNFDGLKYLRNLRKIRADDNPLRQFTERTFLGFEALESLSIKRCGVRSFAYMDRLVSLDSLSLDGNRAKDSDLAFKQLSCIANFKKLSLRGCKFCNNSMYPLRDVRFSGFSSSTSYYDNAILFLNL